MDAQSKDVLNLVRAQRDVAESRLSDTKAELSRLRLACHNYLVWRGRAGADAVENLRASSFHHEQIRAALGHAPRDSAPNPRGEAI